jgi:hypothetical protein
MTLLVTSATGANGAGYGKILTFADDGTLMGVFGDDPRIADPRGLGIDPVDKLLLVNSGSNQILALDCNGRVARATGIVEGLNLGGGNFGPDGRYYVGLRSERTIMAFKRELDGAGEYVLPRAASRSGMTADSFSHRASDHAERATTPFLRSIPGAGCCGHGR